MLQTIKKHWTDILEMMALAIFLIGAGVANIVMFGTGDKASIIVGLIFVIVPVFLTITGIIEAVEWLEES